jgi:hypothetical protein
LVIKREEIDRLKALIKDIESRRLPRMLVKDAMWVFFAENPHLLMLGRFDEHMRQPMRKVELDFFFKDPALRLPRLDFRIPAGRWATLVNLPYDYDLILGNFVFKFGYKAALRKEVLAQSKNDVRKSDSGSLNDYVHLGDRGILVALDYLLADLESRLERPRDKTAILWTPKLWTPQEQARQRSFLTASLAPHFKRWIFSGVCFDDLNPSEFEDLVGDVLFRAGLQVYKVREVPQGGRDLIARGSLIPGEEPIEMAVEVKHRPTVNRPEVQLALAQNRAYPAILFVTSGRFSAGVFEEKAREENRFRLFLKDGFAIGDLVRTHFRLK